MEDFPDDVRQFIEDRIHSLAQLEVLLLLQGAPERAWLPAEVGTSLYTPASDDGGGLRVGISAPSVGGAGIRHGVWQCGQEGGQRFGQFGGGLETVGRLLGQQPFVDGADPSGISGRRVWSRGGACRLWPAIL